MDLIYKPVRASEPTVEPVTLAEAKKQVELPPDDTTHNSHLTDLISQAREQVEHDTGIVAVSGTFSLKADQWPCEDWWELPLRPVTSITSIQYVDTAGATQTWSSSNYALSTTAVRPAILLAYSSSWPTHRGHYQDITLTFVAGYASITVVPKLFKEAVKIQIAMAFDEREGQKIAEAYERLIRRLSRTSYP